MKSAHTFYIPVMGTGFTIDTPLKVGKYGISSVISLVDDVLIEQIRRFHCEKEREPYTPITNTDKDARANRITAYLNLLNKLLQRQMHKLQSSSFTAGSEITKYFELLPKSPLKNLYKKMLTIKDHSNKVDLQNQLRKGIVPGSIDVNIMTKINKNNYHNDEKLPNEFNDALAALRGYANSDLTSSVVFSAGFNPQLYGYLQKFDDFFPDKNGVFKKKIILKVSDYRSAEIQGKYLAKHGLWISEYRIESSVNCGGHAFINDGSLLGQILEEFKQKKHQMTKALFELYRKALCKLKKHEINQPDDVRITVQGGIGTSNEHDFLIKHYGVTETGWGTPFMLVPEATNIDDEHMEKLITATSASASANSDVYLSNSSPLGIPFWNLSTSASEEARKSRINQGCPGAVCVKGFAKLNTEFTKKPICVASNAYQKHKLSQLEQEKTSKEKYLFMQEKTLSKSCICHDLAGSVTKKYGIDKNAKTAVCCGPNIVNFSKIATLTEMVDHIYGKISLLTNNNRPHMFIKELSLYLENLHDEIKKNTQESFTNAQKKLQNIKNNLCEGIAYYRDLAKTLAEKQRNKFMVNLEELSQKLEAMNVSCYSAVN